MAEEKSFIVMDDTVDIGKEPYQCKNEQEQKALDDLIEGFLKEHNL